MAKIIAVNGSPIRSGNIENAMKFLLEATDEKWEIIHLSSLNIRPCLACLRCSHTNRCVQKDDMNELLKKIIEADGLVISAFPTFFSINAATKIFIERMYPLKHRKMMTKGKPGIAVAGGFRDSHIVVDYLSSFFKWFKMDLVGILKVGGNAPCLSCGYGETCAYSNVISMYNKGTKITSEMFYCFEEDKKAQKEAIQLGQMLGERLRNIPSSITTGIKQ